MLRWTVTALIGVVLIWTLARAPRRAPWFCAYLGVLFFHYCGWNPWREIRFDLTNGLLAVLKIAASIEAAVILAAYDWPREQLTRVLVLVLIASLCATMMLGLFSPEMTEYEFYRSARLFANTTAAVFCVFAALMACVRSQPVPPGAIGHAAGLTLFFVAMAAGTWANILMPRSAATWSAINQAFFASGILSCAVWLLWGIGTSNGSGKVLNLKPRL